jgi:regulator of protease activity HflC (stomatin/prohibitin superfamily)
MVLLWVLLGVGILILALGLKLIFQYERGVVFTLGVYSGIRGPGLTWIIPIVQVIQKIDMRIQTIDVPGQEVMTKDNVPARINGVVYFKVVKPDDAIIKIEDFQFAVKQYTQAALRDVVGNQELDFVLTEREKIAQAIEKIVEKETQEWGIVIDSIKIQEIELPQDMKRAMAKQAEAERERRAVVINAEGELKAAKNLTAAAETLMKSPYSMHLRTLQTLREIAANPAQKIVLYLPSDLPETIGKKSKG